MNIESNELNEKYRVGMVITPMSTSDNIERGIAGKPLMLSAKCGKDEFGNDTYRVYRNEKPHELSVAEFN